MRSSNKSIARLPREPFKQRLVRLRDWETRKLIATIITGKMLGVGALIGFIKGFAWMFGGVAWAQEAAVTADSLINPLNTVWVLVAAFLVFFMQAGFMALEAGFARSRETVNIMVSCIFDTCLCGIIYWAWGFAFQFGEGNGFIGTQFFGLSGAPATYGTTGIAFLAFFLFQFAFADTASTITTGAMIGRTSFKGDIIYSFFVSGFLYPIFGHWAWGPGGWLGNMSVPALANFTDGTVFRDFAGSTVVHTVGGIIALAGAMALGPRLGRKFKSEGGGPTAPSDLSIASIGAVILWFGWYGFNPGSTLSAMDFEGIGRVAANTTLAAAAGGLVAMLFVYPRSKKWDVGMSINGFLGGLVAITAPCYWVSPGAAIVIGAVAGVVVPLVTDLLEKAKIDDPVGAVPVHLANGIWGTLSIGLLASGDFGIPGPGGADTATTITGLFYGGGIGQLMAQAIGSLACLIAVGGAAFVMMYVLKGMGILRLGRDEELEGIDIVEHGTAAYHVEFGHGMTYSTPVGISSPIKEPVSGKAEDLTEVE